MIKLSGMVAAAALCIGLAAPAHAGFSLVGGTGGTIPGGLPNEFLPLFGGPASLDGIYGANVDVDTFGGPMVLTIDFFGAEADFKNEFNLIGSELFAHTGGTIIAGRLATPLDSFQTLIVGAGLLPFDFDTNSDTGASVANGSHLDDSASGALGPNFFASCAPTGGGGQTTRDCDVLYLFLDDQGGSNDDNHDDFLVRLTLSAVPVPEPASMGVLLAGVAMVVRRRRK